MMLLNWELIVDHSEALNIISKLYWNYVQIIHLNFIEINAYLHALHL